MPSQDGPETGNIVNGHNLKLAPASANTKIGVVASGGAATEEPLTFRNLTEAERDAFIEALDDEGRRLLAEIEGRKEQSDTE